MRRTEPLIAAVSAATGATAVLLLDPRTGRRRRALLRDKLGHYLRVVGRSLGRRLRWLSGPVTAAPKAVISKVPVPGRRSYVDEADLKHRVETELGRDLSRTQGTINFDAVDNVIRVRGTVADEPTAIRIVERAAEVEGVGAAVSLMRTADGRRVGGRAGNISILDAWPRVEVQSKKVRKALQGRWPALSDSDILASEGHPGMLCQRIVALTAEPEPAVRTALDDILLAEI